MTQGTCQHHKDIYERLCSKLHFRGQWAIDFDSSEKNVEVLRQAADIIAAVSDEDGVLHADCPWQASLYMLFRTLFLANPENAEELSRAVGLDTASSGPTVTIFRGQKDSSKGFVPSIDHKYLTNDERKKALLATEIFCAAMKSGYYQEKRAKLSDEAFLSIARHYGLRTNLLDFTTDPSVAAYFANQSAQNGEEVTVHLIPLGSVLNDVRILLPPPFLKRLYLQRGFFIQTEQTKFDELHTTCRKLVFKARTDFRVHRQRKQAIDSEVQLLIGNPVIEKVKTLSESTADTWTGATEIDSIETLGAAIAQKQNLNTSLFSNAEALADWVIGAEEMFQQLALIRKEDKVSLAVDVFDKIAADNLYITQLMSTQYLVTSKLMSAGAHGSREVAHEHNLGLEVQRAVMKSAWLSGQIELTDEQLLFARYWDFTHEMRAQRAYYIWKRSGSKHGDDLSHWREAELQLCRVRPSLG